MDAGRLPFGRRCSDLIRSRYPNIPRRVSGYNLNYLLPENGFDVAKALVGSECTCVMVLEATVRLVHNPPARSLLVLGYKDVYSAADHVMVELDERLEANKRMIESLQRAVDISREYLRLLERS